MLLAEAGVPTHIVRYVIFVNISPNKPLGFTNGDGNASSLARVPVHASLFDHLFMSCKHGTDGPCDICKKIERSTYSVGGVQNLIGVMKKTIKFSEIPTDAILYAEKVATHINCEVVEHLERLVNIVDPEMRQAIEIQLAMLRCRDEVADVTNAISDSRKRLAVTEISAKMLRDNIETLEYESQAKSQKLDQALKRTAEIPDRFKEVFEKYWKN
jgi:hypothetical protein